MKKCAVFSLMTQWVFNRGVEEQMKAFLDGFSEVLPLQWLQYFDERELEVRCDYVQRQAAIVITCVTVCPVCPQPNSSTRGRGAFERETRVR